MSSTLMWSPVMKYKGSLSDNLKFALRKRTDWCDNSANGTYGESDIPFLKGLHVGGVEDADKLIKLIEKHGDIQLAEQY